MHMATYHLLPWGESDDPFPSSSLLFNDTLELIVSLPVITYNYQDSLLIAEFQLLTTSAAEYRLNLP